MKKRVPRVMGTQEVANHLGVSFQRVNQLALEDTTMPKPIEVLARGRIWDGAEIVAWAATRRC